MLARRLDGVLRTYPNPEVALYTTYIMAGTGVGKQLLSMGAVSSESQRSYGFKYFLEMRVGSAFTQDILWRSAMNEVSDKKFNKIQNTYPRQWREQRLFVSRPHVMSSRTQLRIKHYKFLSILHSTSNDEIDFRFDPEKYVAWLRQYLHNIYTNPVAHATSASSFRYGRLYESDRQDILVHWVAKLVNAWLKAYPRYALDINGHSTKSESSEVDFGYDALTAAVEAENALRNATFTWLEGTQDNYHDASGVHQKYAEGALQLVAHHTILLALVDELDQLVDWATATRPNLLSLTLNQALYQSRRWHAATVRKAKEERKKELEASTASVAFTTGPYKFYDLRTKVQLDDEGACQRHCVGSYFDAVKSGDTQIFSMRTDAPGRKGRIATIEVQHRQRAGLQSFQEDEPPVKHSMEVTQVRGFANKTITDKAARKALGEFFAYMKFDSDEYRKEVQAAKAQQPPTTLGGLFGIGSTFSGLLSGGKWY